MNEHILSEYNFPNIEKAKFMETYCKIYLCKEEMQNTFFNSFNMFFSNLSLLPLRPTI